MRAKTYRTRPPTMAAICAIVVAAAINGACDGSAAPATPTVAIHLPTAVGTFPVRTPQVNQTPITLPSPSATETNGLAGFLSWLPTLLTATLHRDNTVMSTRIAASEIVCSAETMAAQIVPCTEEGATIRALPRLELYGSQKYVVPETFVADLGDFLDSAVQEASDAFGSGEPGLYAVGIRSDPLGQVQETYVSLLTAIERRPGGDRREALALVFSFNQDRWQVVSYVVASDRVESLLTGAVFFNVLYQRVTS